MQRRGPLPQVGLCRRVAGAVVVEEDETEVTPGKDQCQGCIDAVATDGEGRSLGLLGEPEQGTRPDAVDPVGGDGPRVYRTVVVEGPALCLAVEIRAFALGQIPDRGPYMARTGVADEP